MKVKVKGVMNHHLIIHVAKETENVPWIWFRWLWYSEFTYWYSWPYI